MAGRPKERPTNADATAALRILNRYFTNTPALEADPKMMAALHKPLLSVISEYGPRKLTAAGRPRKKPGPKPKARSTGAAAAPVAKSSGSGAAVASSA